MNTPPGSGVHICRSSSEHPLQTSTQNHPLFLFVLELSTTRLFAKVLFIYLKSDDQETKPVFHRQCNSTDLSDSDRVIHFQ